MESEKVFFKVEKGETFTIDDFRKALGDYYSDNEKRIAFGIAIKTWKSKGFIKEVGREKSSNEKGFGRPKKVYLAIVKIVFQIGAETL